MDEKQDILKRLVYLRMDYPDLVPHFHKDMDYEELKYREEVTMHLIREEKTEKLANNFAMMFSIFHERFVARVNQSILSQENVTEKDAKAVVVMEFIMSMLQNPEFIKNRIRKMMEME